ncbi:MAG TPA: diguanylate cyclase [Dehalococcoidia bacterium]|nr:diguanylate cyclase [Dehalococcoidia bacterium]
MDHTAAPLEAAPAGRLLYLAEHLTDLHAAADLPWLAGRVEFLGEQAVGALLTVLAMPDERGAFRPVRSSAPRTTAARDLWAALGIDALATNSHAAAAFVRAEHAARPDAVDVRDLFPAADASAVAPRAIVAPLLYNRELVGVALFVAQPDDLAESIAGILASHAAVAAAQLRQRDEERRLHSVDARLWVPDEQFLLAQFRREVNRARRYRRQLGLALLRVENEAEIRARFGAFFTDHLLRRIGSQLSASVRDSDVLGALDGAYAVIHCETPLAGTQLSAERLRDAVIDMVAHRFPEAPPVEISVHAVAFPASAATVEDLVGQLTGTSAQRLAS